MTEENIIENKIKKIALDIDDFSNNSKEITQQSAYVAIKGSKYDGHDFINEAIKNGAKYIIHQSILTETYPDQVTFLKVENTVKIYNLLARFFYNKSPKNIVAVTGTSGKSSVVDLFNQIVTLLGKKSAIIGTNGVKGFAVATKQNNLTTPDAKSFFQYLSQAYDNEIDYLAFEASSHGLDQHRIDGVNIKSAAFTNFSHEHLDYHHNLQSYFDAKMILFNTILNNGNAIINADIPEYSDILKHCSNHNIIDYGKNAKFIKLLDVSNSNNSTIVKIIINNIIYNFTVNLFGYFQIENLLCAIGLVMSLGFNIEDIISIMPKIIPIKGRLEKISVTKNIFVDYAHKPDALEKVLLSLNEIKQGKLILVFGCGGQRDNAKRPIMGEIAYNNADIIIVTDDNPRHENPDNIRQEIINKCPTAINIGNRKDAIDHAISLMQEQDILLIAGKGHEDYQIIGDKKFDFDDAEIVKGIIKDNILKV
jgi:UDP-N-acetylmuramoyl-L-alanyl-D-glutamate--2,6-diaminopimelate ligase